MTIKSVIVYKDGRLWYELRALRLWHWQQAMQCRKSAQSKQFIAVGISEDARKLADFHIKQVQVLNSFFEPGDIAEKDAD